jgi:hypothetical protein
VFTINHSLSRTSFGKATYSTIHLNKIVNDPIKKILPCAWAGKSSEPVPIISGSICFCLALFVSFGTCPELVEGSGEKEKELVWTKQNPVE